LLYNSLMVNLLIGISSLISLVILVVMLFTTTPMMVGPLGIMLAFVLLYVLVFGIITWVMNLFLKVVFLKNRTTQTDYFKAGIIAMYPIMLLILVASSVTNLLVLIFLPAIFVGLLFFVFTKMVK